MYKRTQEAIISTPPPPYTCMFQAQFGKAEYSDIAVAITTRIDAAGCFGVIEYCKENRIQEMAKLKVIQNGEEKPALEFKNFISRGDQNDSYNRVRKPDGYCGARTVEVLEPVKINHVFQYGSSQNTRVIDCEGLSCALTNGEKENSMKDWTGSRVSVYRNLAGAGHSGYEREQHDFYATSPIATRLLLDIEEFDKDIWEPACGLKHISKCFEERGHNVWNTDLVNRTGDIEKMDFLSCDVEWHGDIVTNPPYKYATEFVQKALDCVEDGHKVAMFLKIQFLEGKKRKELFKVHPPKTVWVASSRLSCAINAQWEHPETECSGSAVCYCWFVWEKGYKGDTVVKWFN